MYRQSQIITELVYKMSQEKEMFAPGERPFAHVIYSDLLTPEIMSRFPHVEILKQQEFDIFLKLMVKNSCQLILKLEWRDDNSFYFQINEIKIEMATDQ